jgi:RNA polymerase sigma factor (TIGR02999 family)
MSEVTRLLEAIDQGDPQATADLLPLIYDELRKLAAQKLACEPPGQTLQPTALVHEAFIRLVGSDRGDRWDNRGHFFSAAAEAMRRILVDNARRKHALRRGGAAKHLSLDRIQIASISRDDELLALDEALRRLEQIDHAKAELVKLRYFAGMTIPQAAEALRISITTANRYWAYARAWLHEELQSDSDSTAR